MRYVYMALIVLVTAIVVTFKYQNLETVTVSFLSASITLPLSVFTLLIYFLGMFTGSFVVTLIRSWILGASQRPSNPSAKTKPE